jgi:hypothetical protein
MQVKTQANGALLSLSTESDGSAVSIATKHRLFQNTLCICKIFVDALTCQELESGEEP